MSKPRTASEPISFRVPLDTHEYLTAKAERKGITVNNYVRDHIIRAVDNDKAKAAATAIASAPSKRPTKKAATK